MSGTRAVKVRYFAAAAEAAGCEEESLSIGRDATLADLKRELVQQHGALMAKVVDSGSFLIGGVARRDPDAALADTVDVLPPFAGG